MLAIVAVLLTVADVARELGVSTRWVLARIAAAELRAIRGIGRGFRIRRAWLEAFLATREVCAKDVSPRPRRAVRAKCGAKPFASAGEARAVLLDLARRRP